MARITVADGWQPQTLAFLDMLAYSEIGPALLAASDDGYNVLVGSTPSRPLLFDSYAKHPQVLNHALNSTAAGRYQIIRGTWLGVAGELGLSSFSPENQDEAAVELVRGRGGIEHIADGDIAGAIAVCSKEWASLPGAGYGQHENRMSDLLKAYADALARYL